ncbi:hypothetical protein PV328_004009 [Microctonus aethiopoides]|uniref:Uncharacterized protein n=1 Tax=Microctonus aethiopoides TaxID=144406 RepID=A0AA39F9M0_9HYME|nr:hypothetical protein PV328_004009 [Microctonus aethiopoides]
MPAISVVPVDLAVKALIKYITYINTDQLPNYSSRVWRDISDELKGLWDVPAINENGVNYGVMNGRCKDRSCLNSVRGIIKDLPAVVITMKCRDTRFHKHADVKRPLNGEKRKEVQKKLLRFGVLDWKKRKLETF